MGDMLVFRGVYLEQNKWQKTVKIGWYYILPIPPATLEAENIIRCSFDCSDFGWLLSEIRPSSVMPISGENDPAVSNATGHPNETQNKRKELTQWCVSGEQIEFRINLPTFIAICLKKEGKNKIKTKQADPK